MHYLLVLWAGLLKMLCIHFFQIDSFVKVPATRASHKGKAENDNRWSGKVGM